MPRWYGGARYGVQEIRRAYVDLVPGSQNVTGALLLKTIGDVVQVSGQIMGLSPGPHGFHIHMTGDTGNTCKAAGGHFNPDEVGITLVYS